MSKNGSGALSAAGKAAKEGPRPLTAQIAGRGFAAFLFFAGESGTNRPPSYCITFRHFSSRSLALAEATGKDRKTSRSKRRARRLKRDAPRKKCRLPRFNRGPARFNCDASRGKCDVSH